MLGRLELHAAEFLNASSPLVERAPQLLHALAVVPNTRVAVLSESFSSVGHPPPHAEDIAISMRGSRAYRDLIGGAEVTQSVAV